MCKLHFCVARTLRVWRMSSHQLARFPANRFVSHVRGYYYTSLIPEGLIVLGGEHISQYA